MSDADVLPVPEPARKDARSLRSAARMASGWEAACKSTRRSVGGPCRVGVSMLADLARHIANAYEQEQRLERAPVLERIKAAFDAELSEPTDHPKGR